MRVPGAAARADPRRAHRLLPPHPVPVLGDLPHPPAAGAASSRACSGRTWSAFTPRPTSGTSPPRCCGRPARGPRWTGSPGAGGRCGSASSRWASIAGHWQALAADPEVLQETRTLRGGAQRLLVGIDRLDYTKGISAPAARLRAAAAATARSCASRCASSRWRCHRAPGWARTRGCARRWTRWSAASTAGSRRPPGRPCTTSTAGCRPARWSRSTAPADVLVVTPIRDGMNLVAKEFVAARTDDDGVLVLSEFTGAAAELAEALLVNPYDLEGTAEALLPALSMPAEERHLRMAAPANQGRDVRRAPLGTRVPRPTGVGPRNRRMRSAPRRHRCSRRAQARDPRRRTRPSLLLDYDGTLVEFAPTPDLAVPDGASARAARGRSLGAYVRSRGERTPSRHAGALVGGSPHRPPRRARLLVPAAGRALDGAVVDPSGWLPQVKAILEEYAARTPGALVEEKTAGLAWHYRAADPEFGAAQAKISCSTSRRSSPTRRPRCSPATRWWRSAPRA